MSYDLESLDWQDDFDSSNIKAFAYQEGTGLFVRFKSDKVALYPNATESDYDGLRNADSKGSYFNQFIKPYHSDFSYVN
jgi:hypothetical protein